MKELDGYIWPPDELLEWLEWQAPARLEQAVWFASLDGDGSGMLYALDAHGTVIGPGPLYWIERRRQHRPQQRAPQPSVESPDPHG